MKKIAFLPAHPSQVWLLHSIQTYLMAQSKYEFIWVLRDKDISCELADRLGIKYQCISTASTGLLGNAVELAGNIFKCLKIGKKRKIDLWVTKYGAGNIAGFLLQQKSLSFNDDDVDQVPLIAHTSYPFAERILCPDVLRMGSYDKKSRRYAGCHELIYLHPNRFIPDPGVYRELGIDPSRKFILMRLSALTAHHDKNIRGISEAVVMRVIGLCTKLNIQCYISSEKTLPSSLSSYRLNIPVHRIHHALAFACLFIGDSQTMTSEAAVLGTPAFRLSDFQGRLSVIDEFERYRLAFGFSPDDQENFLTAVERMLIGVDLEKYNSNHRKFLTDKSDPVPWFSEQIIQVLESN
ncbi:hypothetical protein [Alkalimarinus alittae]|uniref:DUF354 domain-containing protein n=1 Tax=Alkalimarinus alittae TaxID=2961619 RepID=A0ABY6MZ92_9ALTE|nr:hypothetical protein [Alkalimarinus alittae]UZE95161.1 hypothetical protein NKI27_13940 [Alkalimarinus alittae]